MKTITQEMFGVHALDLEGTPLVSAAMATQPEAVEVMGQIKDMMRHLLGSKMSDDEVAVVSRSLLSLQIIPVTVTYQMEA